MEAPAKHHGHTMEPQEYDGNHIESPAICPREVFAGWQNRQGLRPGYRRGESFSM